jgi:hypothetical protein
MGKNRKKNLEGGSGRECDWDKQIEIAKKWRNGIGDQQIEENYIKERRSVEKREREDGEGENEKVFKKVQKGKM